MSLKQFISLEEYEDPAGEQVTADLPLNLAEEAQAVPESPCPLVGEFNETEAAIVAVEAYLGFLKQHPEGVSAQTAEAMQLGLEVYGGLLKGATEFMPSVESFGGTSSRQKATMVSVESLGEKAKALGGKLVELIRQMIAWAKQFYEKISTDFDTLGEKAEALKKRADSYASLQPRTPHIEVNNLAGLYAKGKYMGDDPRMMAGLAAYVAVAYPATMATYLAGVTNVIMQTARGNMSEADITHAISSLASPMANYTRGGLADATFYGDARMMLKHSNAQGLDSYFDYQWEMVKGPSTAGSNTQVKVRDAAKISQQASAIIKVCASFSESRDANAKLVSGAEQFATAAESLQKVLDAGRLGSSAEAAQHLLTASKKLPKLLGPGLSSVYVYCHKVLVVMLAVMDRELTTYASANAADK